MKTWLKEQAMMAVFVIFHWNRVALAIHMYSRTGLPLRPLLNEPDWIVGLLMRAYEGNPDTLGRMAYALAGIEWTNRKIERKLADQCVKALTPT